MGNGLKLWNRIILITIFFLVILCLPFSKADVFSWETPYYAYNFTGSGEGFTYFAGGASANPDYTNNDFRSSNTNQVAINNTLELNGTFKIDFIYTYSELSNWVNRIGMHNASNTCTGAWDSALFWQINPTASQILSYTHNCVATQTLVNTCNYGSSSSGDSFTIEQLTNGTYYISHNGINVCNATWSNYGNPELYDQIILASRKNTQHLDNVNISIAFATAPPPAFVFDRLDLVNNSDIKNNLSLDIFYNFTYSMITNYTLNCELITDNITTTSETVLLNETNSFNIAFEGYYGVKEYSINCTNNEVNAYSGIYIYNLDTYSLLNYNYNKNMWGEIEMIALGIIFIIFFAWLGLQLATPIIISVSGLGFFLIAFEMGYNYLQEGLFYQGAIMWASIFLGIGVLLFGIIAQLMTVAQRRESNDPYQKIKY